MSAHKKKLVLGVDFDDDLGRAGIKTPVIGYSDVLEAAKKYAMYNPQDADLNVIFMTLKVYKDLRNEGLPIEVAIIAGHEKGGVRAGAKISSETKKVVDFTGADEVVLVVDSAEDESVIPIIQSIVPIVGIEKVVVEQMRSVEETYILIGRYLRKIIEERRFSKIFLGLPGLLLLSYILVSLSPYSSYAFTITSLMLGLFLVLKGFGVTDSIGRWWKASPITRLSLTLSLASASVAGAIAYVALLTHNFSTDIKSIAYYIDMVLPYGVVSFIPLIVGRLAFRLLHKSIRVWRDFMALATLAIMYQFFSRLTNIVLSSQSTDLGVVLKLISENYIIQTFLLYITIIMSVSITLYAIEKELV